MHAWRSDDFFTKSLRTKDLFPGRSPRNRSRKCDRKIDSAFLCLSHKSGQVTCVLIQKRPGGTGGLSLANAKSAVRGNGESPLKLQVHCRAVLLQAERGK